MSDVECPYCEKEVEICHDDGFGYEEGVDHNYQCDGCEKNFTFQTSILFSFEAEKAPCLNGEGDHVFRAVAHYPNAWPDWVKCTICGEENRGVLRPDSI